MINTLESHLWIQDKNVKDLPVKSITAMLLREIVRQPLHVVPLREKVDFNRDMASHVTMQEVAAAKVAVVEQSIVIEIIIIGQGIMTDLT
jgi:hypothetical protein